MQDSPDHPVGPALQDRLLALAARTNDVALQRVAHGEPPRDGSTMATEQERGDWVNTCLMDAFKKTGDAEVFALLFERNQDSFLRAITGRLRRCRAAFDANDVLQESFLNIYRYPHRFLADRADAFRSWGHRIVRNTLIGFYRGQVRQPRPLDLDDESQQPVDPRVHPPERVASDHESVDLVNQAFVLFLSLYLMHFNRLSPREQRALTLAEVDGWCYRDISRALAIQVTNVRVMIYRIRRRICQGLAESLAALDRMDLGAMQTLMIGAGRRSDASALRK